MGHRWSLVWLGLTGCGRIAFDPLGGTDAMAPAVKLEGGHVIAAHVCSGPFTVTILDDAAAGTLPLSGAQSGAFYSDADCVNAIASVTLTPGASAQTFYYRNPLAEQLLLAAGASAPLAVSVQMLSAGSSHTCLARDGALYCWGRGAEGQLGDDTTSPALRPAIGTGFTTGITAVSAGGYSTCAVAGDKAYCWGLNTDGQLGIGVTGGITTSPLGVSTLGTDVTAISIGLYHACATHGGALSCWGDNTTGALGIGSTGNTYDVPQAVQGLAATPDQMTVGYDHTCVVTAGTARCWGHNDGGVNASALGYPESGPATSMPTMPVTTLNGTTRWIQVAGPHACAIGNGGVARCWGLQSTTFNLGNNNLPDTYLPTVVTGMTSGVGDLSLGQSNEPGNCLVQNGEAYCWGQNTYGNVGDNSMIHALTPQRVQGITERVLAVSTGEDHACALLVSGAVACWGAGTEGQLGDGAGVNAPTAVLADFP